MKPFVFAAGLIACLAAAAVPSQVEARQICNEIARDAETAFNNFQAADARGDEGAMATYYIRFETKMKAFKSHGCG